MVSVPTNFENDCSKDVRKIWNLINTVLNRNKKSFNVSELHINNSVRYIADVIKK